MSRKTALLGLLVATACGGVAKGGGEPAANEPQKDSAPSAGGSTEWPVAATPAPPAIPPFPDVCSRFGFQFSPRGGGDPVVNCPCIIGAYARCDASSCLASVDCDVACAAIGEPYTPTLDDCLGTCPGLPDCGLPPDLAQSCLTLPGGAGDVCFNHWCLSDDDCAPNEPCVAVRDDGVRMCAQGGQCNSTADCRDGARCALPDASFVGFCATGEDFSICFRDSDCRTGEHCALGVDESAPPEWGQCSSGLNAAPCGQDDDCDGRKCYSRRCSTGIVDSNCVTNDDCEPGLQCVKLGIMWAPDEAICTDGGVQSICQSDAQCQAGLYCTHGSCSDGLNGSLCDRDEQCGSGRCLLGADDEACASGEPGARCIDAGDCVSGSCYRTEGLYARQTGVCE